MSAAVESPEVASTVKDPPSETVKGMAAKFMALRTEEKLSTEGTAAPNKEDPANPTKSPVDRILTPPKKEELPTPPADPLSEFKDDKTAAANIPKMRALIGKNLEEIKALKLEVEEAKKAVAPVKEQEELKTRLEALQKERDDLAQAVKMGNPEKSDEYQQMIRDRGTLIEKMTNRLTDFGGDGAKLKEALSLSGKSKVAALKEVMAELDVEDKTVLRLMVEDLEKLDEKRKDFLADADKTWSTKQQERLAKERELQEAKTRELSTEVQALKKTLPEEFFMLRTAEESPEWNEAVEKAFTEAEAMARGQRPRNEVLRTLAMGLRANHLAELFKTEREARLKAEAKLAGRANAGPGIVGGKAPVPSNGEQKSRGAIFAGMLASGQIHPD